MKYICKKSSNQEMFAISLLSCSRYNANFKFDQSVFAIFSRSVRMTTHRWSTTPAIIDELQTSLITSFVFLGVNSPVELVASPRASARNGAQRRWLGFYFQIIFCPSLIGFCFGEVRNGLWRSQKRCKKRFCTYHVLVLQ